MNIRSNIQYCMWMKKSCTQIDVLPSMQRKSNIHTHLKGHQTHKENKTNFISEKEKQGEKYENQTAHKTTQLYQTLDCGWWTKNLTSELVSERKRERERWIKSTAVHLYVYKQTQHSRQKAYALNKSIEFMNETYANKKNSQFNVIINYYLSDFASIRSVILAVPMLSAVCGCVYVNFVWLIYTMSVGARVYSLCSSCSVWRAWFRWLSYLWLFSIDLVLVLYTFSFNWLLNSTHETTYN